MEFSSPWWKVRKTFMLAHVGIQGKVGLYSHAMFSPRQPSCGDYKFQTGFEKPCPQYRGLAGDTDSATLESCLGCVEFSNTPVCEKAG
jgi:hypothetical protein